MSRVDIVIFGATGYTGRRAAVELARTARGRPLAWAVAGRSRSKLESLMLDVAQITGEDQSQVRIIIADVSDEESLQQMCSQARVVANCCGPYRQLGEPVVRAAVQNRCHHVDVTGEPQFIESMQLKYDGLAREAGVYVISACGFDSVPNDMGVCYLQQNFGGTLNSVESYLSTRLPPQYAAEARAHGVIHYGTWDSLVQSLAHWNELRPLRKQLYPEKLPTFEPKLLPRWAIHRRSRASPWSVPFPGADNSIVYRSQRARYEASHRRPAQFRAYAQAGGLRAALLAVLAAALLYLATRLDFMCNLLLKYPRFFTGGIVSHEGPTDNVTNNTSFHMTLYGEGWGVEEGEGGPLGGRPDRRVVAKVSGTNPGYGATVMALIQCALTVIEEREHMPGKGGVLTTAVAFENTTLIKRLHENGLKFEIIETSNI